MMHFGVEGGALVFYVDGKPLRKMTTRADLQEFVAKGALFGRVVVEGQEISGATFWRAARDAAGILAGDERGNR